jgi:predicted nucleic acid-binding protein
LSVYLDASALVALFVPDRFATRSFAFLESTRPVLLVSDFAAAEFASALGIRLRTGQLTAPQIRAVFAAFDAWTARTTRRVETRSTDVAGADAFLRRLDLNLRTPDALHIAIAQRENAVLMTFDEAMAASARALGTEVVPA